MTTPESAQPESVDLRGIWSHEALDFTPWLANNLHLLGAAVGIDLKLVQTEAFGRAGFLDILAETADGGKVAIENQLEPSDSDHLARLMGYAAEWDTNILIWVAPQFSEYHLRMLGWLKNAMADSKEIYAVTVGLVRGGDLRPTDANSVGPGFHPVFASIELHNNWPKPPILTPEEQENLPQKRQAFFQRLREDLRGNEFADRAARIDGQSLTLPSGFSGISYTASFGGNRPFVFLWISLGSRADERAESRRIYDALSEYQTELLRDLPDLQFDVIGQHGGWRRVSLGMTRDGHLGDSDETLDEIRDWMGENILKLKDVIQPRLAKVMETFHRNAREEGS